MNTLRLNIKGFKHQTLTGFGNAKLNVVYTINALGKRSNQRIILEKEFQAVQDSFLSQGIHTIDIDTLDKHINSMGAGYFNYTSGYKNDQKLLLSNGFLVAFIDHYSPDRETANNTAKHLLELYDNKCPVRQIRRCRTTFNNFIHKFVTLMVSIYTKDAQEISSRFSRMLEQFFSATYWRLKHKIPQIKFIDCPELTKKILELISQPFNIAFKDVILSIKGHHLRSYCPL